MSRIVRGLRQALSALWSTPPIRRLLQERRHPDLDATTSRRTCRRCVALVAGCDVDVCVPVRLIHARVRKYILPTLVGPVDPGFCGDALAVLGVSTGRHDGAADAGQRAAQ